jgi:hypothetical protein
MKLIYATLLAVVLLGCGPSAKALQAKAADAAARGANAALPALVESYRRQGLAAIDAASTPAEAKASLALVEQKWKPVWEAWKAVGAAHDIWAGALETGGDDAAAFEAVRRSFCALRSLPPAREVLPQVPVIVCQEAP